MGGGGLVSSPMTSNTNPMTDVALWVTLWSSSTMTSM
jgi:hypothetical protein